RLLKATERVLLREIERRHQQAFRTLDELAVLERLLSSIDLGLERLKLAVACGRELDRGPELAGGDRCRQVRAHTACDRPLDQARVVYAGDDDNRPTQAVVCQLLG